MNVDLTKKVGQSVRLLESIVKTCNDIELAYSGGKDSDVILELARIAGIPFTAIYRNTTIDPAGTIKHVKDNKVKIQQPKETFFELIKRKGFPTRRARFCCEALKEYKIKDTCILGIRAAESHKRAENYKEPIKCRIYKGWFVWEKGYTGDTVLKWIEC